MKFNNKTQAAVMNLMEAKKSNRLSEIQEKLRRYEAKLASDLVSLESKCKSTREFSDKVFGYFENLGHNFISFSLLHPEKRYFSMYIQIDLGRFIYHPYSEWDLSKIKPLNDLNENEIAEYISLGGDPDYFKRDCIEIEFIEGVTNEFKMVEG